jgi:NitT/TauT family transport system substrate-binding protein
MTGTAQRCHLAAMALPGKSDATLTLVGYVFRGGWAERNRALFARFFAMTSEAKKILAESLAEWQQLAPRIGVSGDAAMETYRRRYIEGIPRLPVADEVVDAQVLYRIFSDAGGADLVGQAHELAPGTFYSAGPIE